MLSGHSVAAWYGLSGHAFVIESPAMFCDHLGAAPMSIYLFSCGLHFFCILVSLTKL